MKTEPYIHPPVPRFEVRRQLGLTDEHVAVGTIARLFHLKGHDDLLDAAPALCRKFPNLRFLWVGDGLLRPAFEERIAGMGLQDRFILTGLVPPTKVPELTNAMDILVHPSRREGLARAIPQGSLAKCPVVTYDIDGNREGIIEGQTGWAAPPFDAGKLLEHLELLLRDAGLRTAHGRSGPGVCPAAVWGRCHGRGAGACISGGVDVAFVFAMPVVHSYPQSAPMNWTDEH